MSNGSPPYAAYRAVNTVRTVALDKCPLGIGEVWMRLWSDCCHMKTKAAATTACKNTQLCAGLRSGIEANLHAVHAIWPLSAGWTKDGALGEEDDGNPSNDTTLLRRIHAEGVLDPRTDPNVAAEDATFTRYKPGTGFGSELFDARNGFNELNCYLMLWNVAHRWNRGSRFAFNRDWHWVRCLVRSEPGEPGLVIHSKEGITQGDYLAMSLYGVALMPLTSKMREAIPDALQPWYCDDAGMAGKALPNARCLDFLVKCGPAYLAGNVGDMSATRRNPKKSSAASSPRSRPPPASSPHVAPALFVWSSVCLLLWFVVASSLHPLLSRPVPSRCRATSFYYNSSLVVHLVVVVKSSRPTVTVAVPPLPPPVCRAVLLSPPPRRRALSRSHSRSRSRSCRHRNSLVVDCCLSLLLSPSPLPTSSPSSSSSPSSKPSAHDIANDVSSRTKSVDRALERYGRRERAWRTAPMVDDTPAYGYYPKPRKSYYICKAEDEPAARRAFEGYNLEINYSRAAVPGRLLRKRPEEGVVAGRLSQQMEIDGGYRQLLTLSIKLGGLAICNPVDTAHGTHSASLVATHHLTVSLMCRDTRFDLATHCTFATEAGQAARKSRLINERIFNMRITDTDAKSYRKKEFGKVLSQHEKEKKDKYLQTCLEMQKDFTPMVYLVDGIAGCDARNAKKRLATYLAIGSRDGGGVGEDARLEKNAWGFAVLPV
ncbi:hypothetical protein ACHAXA_008618 [Cyclostephanos tholiformis]|uniref:Uncharacterized protein n=1 Tax=Cyclostephanos tholiformis TaxID=382380 RepID=A0ABD3SPL9_9STRA